MERVVCTRGWTECGVKFFRNDLRYWAGEHGGILAGMKRRSMTYGISNMQHLRYGHIGPGNRI